MSTPGLPETISALSAPPLPLVGNELYPLSRPGDATQSYRATGEQITYQRTPYSFGAKGDGVADDAAAINAGIAWAAATQGAVLAIPKGTFRCASSIYALSGATVICTSTANFQRAFSTTGAGGFLGQIDPITRISNFTWIGGVFTQPTPTSFDGNVISLFGNYLTLEGITANNYGGQNGRFVLIGGDYVSLRNLRAINPNLKRGVGGIRLYGGNHFRCFDSVIDSGDDIFQFVQGPIPEHYPDPDPPPTANLDIYDAWYIGCSGTTWGGRVIAAGMGDRNASLGVETMTCNTSYSGWIACSGVGGTGSAITLENRNSSGAIHHIYIGQGSVSGPTSISPHLATLYSPAAGGVHNIAFDDYSLLAPPLKAFEILTNVWDVTWNGGRIEGPLTTDPTNQTTVLINGAQRVKFSHVDIGGAKNTPTQPLVNMGTTSGTPVSRVVFEDCNFYDIPSGEYAINCDYATRCGAQGCTFTPAALAAAPLAMNLSGNASTCFAFNNDDSAMPLTTNFTVQPNFSHKMIGNQKDVRTLGTSLGVVPAMAVSSSVVLTQVYINGPEVQATTGGTDKSYTLPPNCSDGATLRWRKVDVGVGLALFKSGTTTVATGTNQGDHGMLRYDVATTLWEPL